MSDISKKMSELVKSFEVKEINESVMTFVATKEIRDRDNDIVYVGANEKGKGILTENYMANPVFLPCHNIHAMSIGKCTALRKSVDGAGVNQLEADIEFAETEAGKEAKYLYGNGFMKAVSIRFRPKEYIYNEAERGIDVFTSELLEISAVPLPANQAALLKKGFEAERELSELKKSLIENKISERLEAISKTIGGTSAQSEKGDGNKKIYDAIFELAKKIQE